MSFLTISVNANQGIYTKQFIFAHSETLPLVSAWKGWDVSKSNGRLSQAFSWNEVGIKADAWTIGALYRMDAVLQYTNETMELLYQTKNHLPLSTGSKIPVSLDVTLYEMRGTRLARVFQITPAISITTGISIYETLWLVEGGLHGDAIVTGDKDYDFQFDVDYYYSKDYLFKRPLNSRPTGWGYSSDLNVSANFPERGIKLDLQIFDLYGRLTWPGAPHTVAQANSGAKQYDDLGYVRFDPVLTGRESNTTFYQTPIRKIKLLSQFEQAEHILLTELLYTPAVFYSAVGYGRKKEIWEWAVLTMPTTMSLDLRIKNPWLQLEIMADHWNPDRVHNAALQLTADWVF